MFVGSGLRHGVLDCAGYAGVARTVTPMMENLVGKKREHDVEIRLI